MRDKFAPVIEGYDCDGITDPFSFQSETFYEDGGNGGTMMDGTTVQDVLTVKHRFSWALNVLTMARYNALISAIDSDSEPDTVSAIVFAPDTNTRYITTFHVTLPVFRFTLDINGAKVAVATSPLVLEETGAEITTLVSSATITAYPNRTTFAVGDTLDYTGLVVTETYEGNVTPECTVFPVVGTPVTQAGTIVVTVSYKGESVGTFNVTVAAVVASGDWWTLFDTGLLYIYCVGDMPNLAYTAWSDYADNITSVAIADCVTSIGDDAFAFNANYYRHRIASVTLSNSITRIGMYAFRNCTKLTRIVIPDSVTQIDYGAFYKCYNLSDISMGNGVTIIGELAFSEISSLTSVTISNSITDIRERAFYECSRLTSVVFPNKAINIERWAFTGTRVQSVTINRNSSVHEYAFEYDCVINYYD